jgi:hypothetical protein
MPPCFSFLSSHPQLTERNPEFAQLLNNPELMRESMRIMSNPVSGYRPGSALIFYRSGIQSDWQMNPPYARLLV